MKKLIAILILFVPLVVLAKANGYYRGYLQAWAGGHVSADQGGGGSVVGTSPNQSDWERFSLVDRTHDSLVSGDQVNIQVYRYQYWSALNGGGGSMLASAPWNSSWETFTIVRRAGPGAIALTDSVGFRTMNGQYLTVRYDLSGAPVMATAPWFSNWETFRLNMNRGPLLSSYWSQDYPFNDLCPMFSNFQGSGSTDKAPAGCDPIAVAQLLGYYQYPSHGIGYHTDQVAYGGGLPGVVPTWTRYFYNSAYNYRNIVPQPVLGSTASDVRALVADVGVALDTNYYVAEEGGSSVSLYPLNLFASNTSNIGYALQTYFGFSSPGTLIFRSSYVSGAAWFNRIKFEIDEGRPVVYLMWAPNGEGHCVVVDGERNDSRGLFFHINFGWGGPEGWATKWYPVDNIVDPHYGYAWNLSNTALVNAHP